MPLPIEQRLSIAATRLVAGSGVVVGGLWLACQVLTDRWLVTQFVFWTPGIFIAIALAAVLALSWLVGARAGQTYEERPRLYGARTRGMLTLVLVLTLGITLLREWRVQGLAMRGGAPSATLRLAVWNPSDPELRAVPAVIDRDVDVLLLANASSHVPIQAWQRAMLPAWAEESDLSAVQILAARNLLVMTKVPVVEWGEVFYRTSLRTTTKRWSEPFVQVIVARLDARQTPLRREVVVWFVDFPSDPMLPRHDLMVEARERLGAWRGPMFRRTPDGRDEPIPGEVLGLPEPDIVAGDFNIPRGAGSLAVLAPGLRNAFRDAGGSLGPFGAGGFPRKWPFWHLGQTLLGEDVRARRYELIDPGDGRHRLQLMELEGRWDEADSSAPPAEGSPAAPTPSGPASAPPSPAPPPSAAPGQTGEGAAGGGAR